MTLADVLRNSNREEPSVKFDTKVVRAGITPDPTTGSIIPPIYETATYVLDEVGKVATFPDYLMWGSFTSLDDMRRAILDGMDPEEAFLKFGRF